MPEADEKSDEELARRLQAGDSSQRENGQAFGRLIGRYETKITRYGKKFLSDPEDIKDLVQDIFLKAYVNIRSFDAARRFSPWIYRIAHNEFVNALKKRHRLPIFSFDFDLLFPHPIAAETADAEAIRKDLRQMLEQHLEAIGPKYREPLVLYYFEELVYEEIAEILRIPVATVGVRLSRGRALLKKMIAK